jgi:hypothetical protein
VWSWQEIQSDRHRYTPPAMPGISVQLWGSFFRLSEEDIV